MEVLAVKRDDLAVPQAADDLEPLVHAAGPVGARDAEARELLDPVADADAELEAAAGENVDGGHVLGDPHRVIEGK